MKIAKRGSLFFAAVVTSFVMLGSSAVGAEVAPTITLSSTSVSPGGTVVVSGTGCSTRGLVVVGVLGADRNTEIATGSTPGAGEGGTWSVPIRIGSTIRPGSYAVTARCTSYRGYDGYNGYNGYDGYNGGGYNGGGSDYAEGGIRVLPSATPPPANGPLIITPNVLSPGESAQVTGAGFTPGESVSIILYSTPVVLTQLKAGANGAISTSVVIPIGTSLGAHKLVAINVQSSNRPWVLQGDLTVVGATVLEVTGVRAATPSAATPAGFLAKTGAEPLPFLLVGILLVGLGGAVLIASRRRLRS